mmetsp:Transcript_33006/g.106103  ORF Transcript_33006/g.106103 Transcript_33006/m.106103 type:complete len:330 (+) Transcript_33006:256-1245(+)
MRRRPERGWRHAPRDDGAACRAGDARGGGRFARRVPCAVRHRPRGASRGIGWDGRPSRHRGGRSYGGRCSGGGAASPEDRLWGLALPAPSRAGAAGGVRQVRHGGPDRGGGARDAPLVPADDADRVPHGGHPRGTHHPRPDAASAHLRARRDVPLAVAAPRGGRGDQRAAAAHALGRARPPRGRPRQRPEDPPAASRRRREPEPPPPRVGCHAADCGRNVQPARGGQAAAAGRRHGRRRLLRRRVGAAHCGAAPIPAGGPLPADGGLPAAPEGQPGAHALRGGPIRRPDERRQHGRRHAPRDNGAAHDAPCGSLHRHELALSAAGQQSR